MGSTADEDRRLYASLCRRIAEAALQKKTAEEIEEFIIESVATRFPEGLVSKTL